MNAFRARHWDKLVVGFSELSVGRGVLIVPTVDVAASEASSSKIGLVGGGEAELAVCNSTSSKVLEG